MLANCAIARRRLVVRTVTPALIVLASMACVRAEIAPAQQASSGDAAPRYELAAASTLPPTHEPLVARGVPTIARSAVQSLAATDGEAPRNSWHLSVINGGRPRGEAAAHRISGDTVLNAHEGTHRDLPLDSGRWTIRVGASPAEAKTSTFAFGAPGAQPAVGDFNGDGQAELGIFVDGRWFLDSNGNGHWDADDVTVRLGSRGDLCVTGDWDGDGKTDVGVFGRSWLGDNHAVKSEAGLPDADNPTQGQRKNAPTAAHKIVTWRAVQVSAGSAWRTDPVDHVFQFGSAGDAAVAGDFNGDGITTVGIFRDGRWTLDSNGDGRFSSEDATFDYGQAGDAPVVGDFNGDGLDEVGVYRAGKWMLDANGDRTLDERDTVVEFGGAGDQPVVGDFTGSGRDQIGLYNAGR